jgi:hypothetical protein
VFAHSQPASFTPTIVATRLYWYEIVMVNDAGDEVTVTEVTQVVVAVVPGHFEAQSRFVSLPRRYVHAICVRAEADLEAATSRWLRFISFTFERRFEVTPSGFLVGRIRPMKGEFRVKVAESV